jgi:indole-3-glycerol phosphate synthase
VQVTTWRPPTGTLAELVGAATSRVEALYGRRGELEERSRASASPPSFVRALDGLSVAVIAEVKRRSPSRGEINRSLDAAAQAAAYVSGGAAAISVLTEPTRFGGDIEDIVAARAAVAVPILRKDFIVDELQIVEARAVGASAVLLIARALDQPRLVDLAATARELSVEPLVEVHDPAELERALAAGARLVGINNRDLETLEVDPDWAVRLLPYVPSTICAIAESGIESRGDVARAAKAGADAVLVGSAVSSASDPTQSVRGLIGVQRERSVRCRDFRGT